MRRCPLINRPRMAGLATALALCVSLLAGATSAQAVVIDTNPATQSQSTVAFNDGDRGSYYYGIAPVPGSNPAFPTVGPSASGQPSCSNMDPFLTPDLAPLPSTGLCWHGGPVMHGNETFVLSWDPLHPSRYWQNTANYVEQFLSDVAAGSGTLSSPYAVTSQYWDGPSAGNRAANSSVFGGGCTDKGTGGLACKFGQTGVQAGSGYAYNYDASLGCSGGATGTNQWSELQSGLWGAAPNDVCLTDAQIRAELQRVIPAAGITNHARAGYTPLVVVLTPPGVVTCLDAGQRECSANGGQTAKFCSYHSQLNVGGTEVSYLVQPWTASWDQSGSLQTYGCDEPDLVSSPIPTSPQPQQATLANLVGERLVSPLSQAHIASIVNPFLNAWFAPTESSGVLTGSEINDNGCVPFGNGLDTVTVGTGSYILQREFNNAGVLVTDPNALKCMPSVLLSPTFVVPSAVSQGDEVQLDGSTTASTLLVPSANYSWNFGDGTSATGPSVVHSYGTGGIYTVTLTVTDRGGNVASVSQQIQVLGANGQPVPVVVSPPPTTSPAPPQNGGLTLRLQLMPQSLRNVLAFGIKVRVSSNMAADGIATVSIPRKAAKRAHIKVGNSPLVRIGIGTVQVKNGTGTLHVHLSQAIAAKLRRLGHVTLTVRLRLVAAGGHRASIVEAGRY